MRSLLPLLILMSAITACTAPVINDSGSDGYVIRYINMNAVYEHEAGRSNEAAVLKNKRDELLRRGDLLDRSTDKIELENYRAEVRRLEESEKKFKAAVYSKIKKAVETVAERHRVDFMLGTGEGVVYSRPVFDLTSEVIDELDKSTRNSSPVWK